MSARFASKLRHHHRDTLRVMTRDGVRVLLPAMASIAAIAAATLVFEWFLVDINGSFDISKITFDLREARACSTAGDCGVVPVSMIKGSFYPTLATITFWGSLVFALLLIYQVGSRVFGGVASESISKAAHGLGTLVVLTAVGAGYVFGPDLEPAELMGLGIDVDRGWGPVAMLLGLMIGHIALYAARDAAIDNPPLIPIDVPLLPRTVAKTHLPMPMTTPPAGTPQLPRTRTPNTPAGMPLVARTRTPTTPAGMRAMPDIYKGKIQFSIVSSESTVAGIDARREDGSSVLVMWRDVVGLVARRLPPELDGHPFVDIVSTAGMTLRLLPWSKLIGEHLEGDPEARMRAFLDIVVPRCPEVKLDRATQAFLDDATKRPAQLPSLALLAKHDQALA
jgi:hypothetical protein